MEEIWKPIIGWEGLYEVSNLGNIKSLERYVNHLNGVRIVHKKILKPIMDDKGYYVVNLWKENVCKRIHIHRIVTENFIPNVLNKPFVNHIDGNKLNNCVNNLEWCTPKENNIHAYKYGLNPKRIKVNQYDLDGNFIKTWNSIKEANNFYKTSHISECCNNKSNRKIAKGYLWKYADK